ncbi:hypothetical protein RHGRI_012134 [Rhododendron griersonianum]|uniref:Uncharacterized protein n=1 Tax=Rhododendron griersonianum TaxID=479676 RepID=A0AAV6KPC7_9ERIC|nr:hypothetical protein RHGRI_012134 [Rhododendron griersonianum]
MVTSKKKKKSKSVDFETVKEQLEEVEETILQLADVKSHRTRKIIVGPLQMDGKALLPEMEESVKKSKRDRKNRTLQFEVQKIQHVLLKLGKF